MLAGDVPALLPLNNIHATELSELDASRFTALVGAAFCALRTIDHQAFLVSFDQNAAYDSANFLWFKARYDRFVYVDRVVVARALRGQGIARAFYTALFAQARAAGHERIVCEVNSDPPNPASMAFHTTLGFEIVGAAHLAEKGNFVHYFSHKIEP